MNQFYKDHLLTVYQSDVMDGLRELPDCSVHCCVTSPPYWGLRDYGVAGQIGLEKTPEEYVAKMVAVFREVKRVLRDDGTLWLNLGDSYASSGNNAVGGNDGLHSTLGGGKDTQRNARRCVGEFPGLKPKDLCGIPWRVAFALQADGWYLRSDIIWHKPNPMPESVTDRPTKAHEYIFLMSKNARYYYDSEAVKEPAGDYDGLTWQDRKEMGEGNRRGFSQNGFSGLATNGSGRNKRSVWTVPEDEWQQFIEWKQLHSRDKKDVWTVPTQCYPESHFATFPEDLIKPCILAGTSAKGCCPNCGAPWERVVETNNPSKAANTGMDMTGGAAKTGNPQTSNGLHRNGGGVYSSSHTLGCQPGCECGHSTLQPCTVLDPFGGSFTTAQVSLELGRKSVIIEINPKYVKLGMERTHVTPSLPLA